MIETQLRTRLSAATDDELVELLAHPSLSEAQHLRAYLGPEVYEQMRSLALRTAARRREPRLHPRGNVVFIPALLHNELLLNENGQKSPIWLSVQAIAAGHLQYLRLDETGLADANPQKPIEVGGLMMRYCGEFLLTLAQYWNVRAFAYDWRKSLRGAATKLHALIEESYQSNEKVQIVAVGEGGIVARLYIALYREHWDRRQGRLVTIGTPHQGAPIYLQALLGHLDITELAANLDLNYKRDDFAALARTFPSIYQLLPFADIDQVELFQARTYSDSAKPSQQHLDGAREVQEILRTAVDPARMVALVGYGRTSCTQVKLPDFQYEYADGDGNMDLRHAQLPAANGKPVPTLYVDVSETPITSTPAVLGALDDLLRLAALDDEKAVENAGQKYGLKTHSELDHVAGTPTSAANDINETEHQRVVQIAHRLRRAGSAMKTSEDIEYERILEGSLVRSLLPGTRRRARSIVVPFDPPSIFVEAITGDISKLDAIDVPTPSGMPVDAIAVGHYLGATPQGGLSALDQDLSTFIYGSGGEKDGAAPAAAAWLLQTLLQRGTIGGELADLFFLPDPRPNGITSQRVIAVAGMGVPGRLGSPELALLVRELCWTLGHIGKKHLATILIGAGQNNMNVQDAVEAWTRGIKLAITGAGKELQLQQITFVEHSPQRLAVLDRRLAQLAGELKERKRMFITHSPLLPDERQKMAAQALAQAQSAIGRDIESLFGEPEEGVQATSVPPIRIAVEADGATIRFAAIGETASIADRPMELDARLVEEANDRLASAIEPEEQKQQGEFLARFLLPEDFHAILSGGGPIVLTLDSTAARIHWEMLCLSEQNLLRLPTSSRPETADTRQPDPDLDLFLGTSFGLTRQLRTPFARPPEPLPQSRRMLRVLVVADPAADDRLTGAEEEGAAVADLLELYNRVTKSDNRIEVVRLIGPAEATRVAVLQHLVTRTYDVLHFAGHCVYDNEQPLKSGWIFTNGERLTASEIKRVDRVPSLVVSNACQSGITPARSGERNANLAPTFAETFFARGVSNFICTAWPVGDREARDFALTLYGSLLGLYPDPNRPEDVASTDIRYYRANPNQPPLTFHAAMREARRAIASADYDRQSWGAYQHYGNPYARLFAE